jgi:membrane protein
MIEALRKPWWLLLKETLAAWSDDYAPSMGAAIAYYTIFSLAPLLVIVTAVAGLVFSREAVTGELFGQVRGLVGDDGGRAIEGLVQSASNPGEGAIAIVGGVIAMIFGATGVFSEIQTAIDRIELLRDPCKRGSFELRLND